MLKEEVLSLLLNVQEPVSGEGICKTLGVTRAAVWKTIDQLRQEGYGIDAAPKRGYTLASVPDRLDTALVRAHLSGHPWQTLVTAVPSVDSTNNACKRLAAEGAPDGTAILTGCQTAGKGRRGRTFVSPPGGLYFSVILRPHAKPEALMHLTAMAAVAAARAVFAVSGVYPDIKWTNDLVLGGKKLCGILTELSVEGETGELQYVVAGIGFNVSQREEDFVGEVSKIATSILRETGRLISRAELSAAMIEELDALYTALRSGETSGYLDEYRRRCVTIGREVQLLWQDTKEKVTALDVDEEFGLIVRRENGTVETVRTGEVSVRGLYGYVE